MRILLLAPQPFYQERGTPIATRLLLKALSQAGHEVDLLTYHLGSDVEFKGLTIFRTMNLSFVKRMPIGFSAGKLLCDALMYFKTVSLLWKGSYDVVHAGEESIFFSLFMFKAKRIIIYDMDSSMPDQLLEKWPFLKHISALMYGFERLAIKRSDLVLPVCDALADRVRGYNASKDLCVLEDVAMDLQPSGDVIDEVRKQLPDNAVVAMYVGNLEHYQGIDLLIDALVVIEGCVELITVFIGGSESDVTRYKAMAENKDVSAQCVFLGARPVADLMLYLAQADILISPRIKGVNTPMKIYSYMGAAKAIIATDIPSHTQVLDSNSAKLVSVDADEFARGLSELCKDENLRNRLATAAYQLAQEKHTYAVFEKKLQAVYQQLGKKNNEA